MLVKGDAASTTKSTVAPGSIDVRKNPNQDLSDLSRNTSNALNELGRIFDKKKIEEQQELAAVFGEPHIGVVFALIEYFLRDNIAQQKPAQTQEEEGI